MVTSKSTFMIKTVAGELARLLDAPEIPSKKAALCEFETPQVCAITGEIITHGYSIKDVTTKATNEFMDTFHGTADGYVSEAVGRLMKVQRIGNVAIVNDVIHRPMISRESALSQGRQCWSDLLLQLRGGDEVMLLITTEPKKRLWQKARFSVAGINTAIYLYDTKTNHDEILKVDICELQEQLRTIENIYTLGFSKDQIRESLLANTKLTKDLGFKEVLLHENTLKRFRGKAAFEVACLVAQKGEKS